MTFSDRLLVLRKERGMTQEQLAEKLGISRQAIAKWEVAQATPDLYNLIQLSDFFHITLDRLVKEPNSACGPASPQAECTPLQADTLAFLLRAKRATYAGKGPEAASSRPSSHDLHYAESDMLYIDSFVGSERFTGEEVLWNGGQPLWAMNYTGRVMDDGFSGDFLKEALLLVSREYPYRGPLVHHNGDYVYHCSVHGEFEWFNGSEEIFCRDTKVYECAFHGGLVR